MKLVYPCYQLDIVLEENKIIVLSIENPSAYSVLLQDIWNQIQGENGGFCLSDKDKVKNIAKEVECIFNPFELQ